MSDAGDGSEREDLIDVGRHRILPRPVAVVGVAILVIGIAVAVLRSHSSGQHPLAVVTVPPHPKSSAPPHAITPATRSHAVPVADSEAALFVDGRLYAYAAGLLTEVPFAAAHRGTAGYGRTVAVPPRGRAGHPGGHPAFVIEPDLAHGRLWLVQLASETGTTVLEYNALTLHLRRVVHWSSDTSAAAVLGGRLYLATSSGLAVLNPGGSRLSRVPVPAGAVSIAADPIRHRLLLLYGRPRASVVRPLQPGHRLGRGTRLSFVAGQILVVDGQIWAGGFSERGASLVHLDPMTLRTDRRSPLQRRLGPGAVLVAAGRYDLFVRSGAGGNGLWCTDARTGAVRARWEVAGVVASTARSTYVLKSPGTVEPLSMRACRG